MLKNLPPLILGLFALPFCSAGQACTPLGDQLTYGTNNIWIGYVYAGQNFETYIGYLNEGSVTSPNFNQDFGGSYSNYSVSGCSFYTDNFTIRYKLTKTFSPGNYTFTVSGDDRIRLSIDGGATWLINQWVFNNYLPVSATVPLHGTYNLVLEYMEGVHQNRVYFNVEQTCVTAPASEPYGNGNVWNGYYYMGVNFETYKGTKSQVTGPSLAFSQNFGGAAVEFPTSNCPVFTDFFSVRYKMRHTFPSNSYTLTVSGDDKYRLSMDGGSSWVIDRWAQNSGNTTRFLTLNLNGTYDMVLEYYEKDGGNLIEFTSSNVILLPLGLETFSGKRIMEGILLSWKMADTESLQHFEIESSVDGQVFQTTGTVQRSSDNGLNYSFKDLTTRSGMIYYRIKMIDQNGKGSYSKVIVINGKDDTGMKVYPTFVTNNVIYLTNDVAINDAVILINDISGRLLIKRSLGFISAKQTTSVFLNDMRLSKGLFIVQLKSGNEAIKTERVLIQ